METLTRTLAIGMQARSLEVTAVMHSHGDFLWRTLQRLGVRDADLSDVLQEVLIVLHRVLPTYDPQRALEPWLFALCARTVSTHRRRAHRRHEVLTDPVDASIALQVSPAESPERAAERSEARIELSAVLDALTPERRALLVVFEIEQLPCEQIARVVGIPVGTVFSRLDRARREFARLAARRRRARGVQP